MKLILIVCLVILAGCSKPQRHYSFTSEQQGEIVHCKIERGSDIYESWFERGTVCHHNPSERVPESNFEVSTPPGENITIRAVPDAASHEAEVYAVEECDHQQSFASRKFVEFCLAHSKAEPKEPCIAGQERNSPIDVNGGYLEVYDCRWHHDKNPRDPTPQQEAAMEKAWRLERTRRKNLPAPVKGIFPDKCKPFDGGASDECTDGELLYRWDNEHQTWMEEGTASSGWCPIEDQWETDYYGHEYHFTLNCNTMQVTPK